MPLLEEKHPPFMSLFDMADRHVPSHFSWGEERNGVLLSIWLEEWWNRFENEEYSSVVW